MALHSFGLSQQSPHVHPQQTELVLEHHEAMLDRLLPAVCEVIAAPSESGDTRFFCLRMVSEVTQLYLMDEELYGSAATGGSSPTSPTRRGAAAVMARRPGAATSAIDKLLRSHIFPTIPKLLQDEDPMPLYALKVRDAAAQNSLVLSSSS